MAPKGAVFFISEQDVIPTRRSADRTSAGVADFPSAWQPSLVDNVANVQIPVHVVPHSGDLSTELSLLSFRKNKRLL